MKRARLRSGVPSSLAHYAIAAGVLTVLGFKGRKRSLGALWAIAPDLDVLTAIPWTVAAPHAPLGADSLIALGYIFGHRGLSHTLLAALLAAGAVWLWTRSRGWTLAAGIAWASHFALDALSPWPIQPFWPVSTVELQAPLVTTLDPLLTAASLLAMAALLGPLAANRWSWWSPQRRRRFQGWGDRWATPAVALAGVAIVLGGLNLGATALAQDVSLAEVRPANMPRTTTVVETDQGWTITTRWAPWTDGSTTRILRLQDETNGTIPPDQIRASVDQAACTLEGLGPYAPITEQAWVAILEDREDGGELALEAFNPVREAMEPGGPRLLVNFADGEVASVALVGGEDRLAWLSVTVPQAVVEAAACP